MEERGSSLGPKDAQDQPPDDEDELIRVFLGDDKEPTPLVDVSESLIHHCANRTCRIARLYVVGETEEKVKAMRKAVEPWTQ